MLSRGQVIWLTFHTQAYDDVNGLTLAIMGTGTQAEYHLKAMFALEECSTIRFKRVMLFGRNKAKLEKGGGMFKFHQIETPLCKCKVLIMQL